MSRRTENISGLQERLGKSLDGMTKQTIDALQLVRTFQSKPVRSQQLRSLLESKVREPRESVPKCQPQADSTDTIRSKPTLPTVLGKRPFTSPERGSPKMRTKVGKIQPDTTESYHSATPNFTAFRKRISSQPCAELLPESSNPPKTPRMHLQSRGSEGDTSAYQRATKLENTSDLRVASASRNPSVNSAGANSAATTAAATLATGYSGSLLKLPTKALNRVDATVSRPPSSVSASSDLSQRYFGKSNTAVTTTSGAASSSIKGLSAESQPEENCTRQKNKLGAAAVVSTALPGVSEEPTDSGDNQKPALTTQINIVKPSTCTDSLATRSVAKSLTHQPVMNSAASKFKTYSQAPVSRLMQPTAASTARANGNHNSRGNSRAISKDITTSSWTNGAGGTQSRELSVKMPPISISKVGVSKTGLQHIVSNSNSALSNSYRNTFSKSVVPPSSFDTKQQPTVESRAQQSTKNNLIMKRPASYNFQIPVLSAPPTLHPPRAADTAPVTSASTTVAPHKLQLIPQSPMDPSHSSTPVRPVLPVVNNVDHSVTQSVDYSNFSNFSYVADWANTPELTKKAIEQQNVDTRKLFGAIPPVDIDAIFGAELRRQGY